MCIALLAIDSHPRFPLVVAANRDEFLARPTEPMHWWPEGFLAGRDVQAGGTWLGLRANGHLALLTNFREIPAGQRARSRGHLVTDYLRGDLQIKGHLFAGFSLIYGRGQNLTYSSNRGPQAIRLNQGVHGLSNGLLNEPWPKVERGKVLLKNALANLTPEALFAVLRDEQTPPDEALPNTGVGRSLERVLATIFIPPQNGYGSRCGTVILRDLDGSFRVWERDYQSGQTRRFKTCQPSQGDP